MYAPFDLKTGCHYDEMTEHLSTLVDDQSKTRHSTGKDSGMGK